MKRNVLYWLPPMVWMAIIYYTSSQSSSEQDVKPFISENFDLTVIEPLVNWMSFSYYGSERSVEAMGLEPFLEFLIRKGAHLGVYLVAAFLIYFAIAKTTRLRGNYRVVITFFLVIHFALVDELNQSFTAERTPYIYDVMLDGFGALVGLGMILLFRRVKVKKVSR
ncbi:VanZ family protein [Halalkalibacillus sediminis]|uniref:VanZ family protein n=1 Tax=Halalkalibacillus sediminis TaxID=2018042 RepID=A0A2I0QUG5_9BACI|nr:VanZ family protein [Halalkalibacillus sediminis]PKR77948.1 VanZ family protein [Halalkalibacillus sediminis]